MSPKREFVDTRVAGSTRGTPMSIDRLLSLPANLLASRDGHVGEPKCDFSHTMGYLERVCQICCVSSNISRIRRPDEPRQASWRGDNFFKGVLGDTYVSIHPGGGPAYNCTDCYIADETLAYEDEEDDRMYSDQSTDGSEPYEYATPDDSDEEMTNGSDTSAAGDDSSDEYPRFLDSVNGRHGSWKEAFQHISNYSQASDEIEHIAGGEHCISIAGYNGHRITLEEMKGCGTFQCLVPKGNGWGGPLPDDEDFEIHGDFFLSGLVDFMNSAGDPLNECRPQRHNFKRPVAVNCFYHEETVSRLCMPFHPTCLEVYKRASLHRFGKVDIKGLTDWFRLEAFFTDFIINFPRHIAVARGSTQWWTHAPGDEWLAANPCFVPDLERILGSVRQDETSPIVQYPVDGISADIDMSRLCVGDCFTSLPMELLLCIIEHVDGKDLASLRLVSRAFHKLPQSVFHGLLVREFPWIWESWCSRPYAWWVKTTELDIRAKEDAWAERKSDLEDWRIPVLADPTESSGCEGNELLIEALKEQLAAINQEEEDFRKPCPVTALCKATTDWRRLYTEVVRNRRKIKGFRKREIVWRDCQYILDRIEHHRAEGRMGDGIDVDPVKTLRDYKKRKAEARAARPGEVVTGNIYDD
ncbi:hypothetical protein FQN54_000358 [Arachnomyces sp. PD_36]|nr:hypothetical protein FQN54_000358 [Arachnomyces sp. PD_36]